MSGVERSIRSTFVLQYIGTLQIYLFADKRKLFSTDKGATPGRLTTKEYCFGPQISRSRSRFLTHVSYLHTFLSLMINSKITMRSQERKKKCYSQQQNTARKIVTTVQIQLVLFWKYFANTVKAARQQFHGRWHLGIFSSLLDCFLHVTYSFSYFLLTKWIYLRVCKTCG